jgi:hypothetical protein
MTDKHSYSFFGQKIAMIVRSSSKSEPHIFFSFIKKQDNGDWEKLSNREGRIIKFSLEEMIMIWQVLQQKNDAWSCYHSFKDKKTQITVKWDKKNEEINFVISLNGYLKPLNSAQVEILKMLLDHLIKEKIEFATNSFSDKKNVQNNSEISERIENQTSEELKENQKESENTFVEEEIIKNNKEKLFVNGIIKSESLKALLIAFDKKEIWMPKSLIHSQYDNSNNQKQQNLLIEKWILTKNQIL